MFHTCNRELGLCGFFLIIVNIHLCPLVVHNQEVVVFSGFVFTYTCHGELGLCGLAIAFVINEYLCAFVVHCKIGVAFALRLTASYCEPAFCRLAAVIGVINIYANAFWIDGEHYVSIVVFNFKQRIVGYTNCLRAVSTACRIKSHWHGLNFSCAKIGVVAATIQIY